MGTTILFIIGTAVPSGSTDSVREAAVEMLRHATVRIIDNSEDNSTWGSGAVVGSDATYVYVLTAHHVVSPGRDLEVHFYEGRSNTLPQFLSCRSVAVIGRSAVADLAFVRVKTTHRPPLLPVCPQNRAMCLTTGTSARSIGYDASGNAVVKTEAIRGSTYRQRLGRRVAFVLTDIPPAMGRSGGPLINRRGQLIGICRGYLAADSLFPAEGLYCSLGEIHHLASRAGIWQTTRAKAKIDSRHSVALREP